MHIVQLIDSLHWGGAQKLILTFAEAVRGQDVRLTVVSLRKHRPDVSLPQDLQAQGARVLVLSASHLLDLPRLVRLVRFLKSESIDILHAHLTYANIVGPIAGRLAGLAVVASIHNESYNPERDNRVRRWLETWALRFGVDRIVAVGRAVIESQQNRFPNQPMVLIPNAVTAVPPISSQRRQALRARLVGDHSRPLLISVGRLSYQKGYMVLLSAFVTVRNSYPEAALVIVGGGHLFEKLKMQIKNLGLEDHVFLLGFRNDVPDLLASSDLFVSSSRWEGIPIAILEAMSASLPVVATDVGDVPLIVTAENGVIVPPNDPAKLADAICALLDDPALMQALGAAGREHVDLHYSPAVWADRLLALYADVLASRQHSAPTMAEAASR